MTSRLARTADEVSSHCKELKIQLSVGLFLAKTLSKKTNAFALNRSIKNMNGKFKIHKVEEIEMAMTVTMPIDHWRKLRTHLDSDSRVLLSYPISTFYSLVSSLIRTAEQEFFEEMKPEK